VDCSRNRAAAAGVTLATVFVTCTDTELVDPAAPGFGLVTVTDILPTCAAVAVPVAVNCADETNVVVSAVPPNITWAPRTNWLPVTVRVNAPTETVAGLTPETTGTGFINVTGLLPETDVLATLIACTDTAFGLGTTAGAKKFPEVLIVPIVEFPPIMPLTCHVTAVLVVPVTVAANCCELPALTFAELGDTVTVMMGGGALTPPPLHPNTNITAANVNASAQGILRFMVATPQTLLLQTRLPSKSFPENDPLWNVRPPLVQRGHCLVRPNREPV